MKKLLGVVALATLLVLIACTDRADSIDEAVCTTDETICTEELDGGEMIFTVCSEGGEIITATVEVRTDVSDWDDEEIESEVVWHNESRAALGAEAGCDLEGDVLVCYEVVEAERMHGNTDLGAFIEIMENEGSTCN